jgi:hypothetical protein
MSGPVPKDPSERRRTNKPARGEWIDIDSPSLDTPVLPPLTTIQKGRLNRKAKNKWRVWRLEPVTAHWSKSDIDTALDILELYNCDDWTRHAAEIRQRETQLALNPKGKRDQRFRITFGVGKEATKEDKTKTTDDNVVELDSRRAALGHGA